MMYSDWSDDEMLDVVFFKLSTQRGAALVSAARAESENPEDECFVIRDEMAAEYIHRMSKKCTTETLLREMERLDHFQTVRSIYGEMARSGMIDEESMRLLVRRLVRWKGEWFYRQLESKL